MKQHYEGLLDPIEQIHQVGDRNNYQNFPLSDFPKMIDPTEDSQESEDSLEAEDSLEEEDSLEVEDIQEAEERHLEDHQEEVGDCHHSPCHKPIKGN